MGDISSLTPSHVKKLLEWQGYGNPRGRFWFIGMEEGGSPPLAELVARADLWRPVEDLAEAPRPWEHNFDLSKSITSVWDGICRIVGALSDEPAWSTGTFVRTYQSEQLGRLSGETFLTEVLPLPKQSVTTWTYEAFWKRKEDYEEEVRPGRLSMLRELHRTCLPEFTFCYGKTNWRYYRSLFKDCLFSELVPGEAEISSDGNSTVVLMQHFSAWGFNTQKIETIIRALNNRERESPMPSSR